MAVSESTTAGRPAATGRRRFAWRRVTVVMAVIGAAPLAAWLALSGMSFSTPESGVITCTVKRGEFVHEISENGDVESANNVEIRCEVAGKGAAGTTILEIVPEGTTVKKGDLVVRLDSSALESELTKQQIVCNNSEAAVIQAKNDYDTAVIAKKEYLEGTYKVDVQKIEQEIIVAQEDLRRAIDYLAYSEKLAAKGYVTKLQLEADRFSVEKSRNTLDSGETKLMVLKEFTRQKMTSQLDANIKTAEAKLKSQEASHSLDLEQLDEAKQQVEKCTIRSPEAGQVVYANVSTRHGTDTIIAEGEKVREQQVIVRLPDPTQMQVNVKISEAKVTMVKAGMPATIRLDAFPDLKLAGEVKTVNELPEPSNWFSSGGKEYKAIVRITNPPPGLRPGLTAEVKIHVERVPDALLTPSQAIFEHGKKYYCVVEKDGRCEAREVQIGSTNDEVVIVREGLEEGDQLVLHASAHRGKVGNLPKLAEEGKAKEGGPPDAPGQGPTPEQAPKAAGPPKRGPADGPPKSESAGAGPPGADASRAERRGRPPGGDPFAKFDKNTDGKLEEGEVPAAFWARLKTADKDGDGAIDRGEMTAAMSQMRGAGGGPPDGSPGGPRPGGGAPP